MPHNFGEWQNEIAPTTETGGVIAHKDCETCGKHFDASGAELTDLTIEKLPVVEKKAPLSSGAIIGITVAVTVCFVSATETLAYVIYKKTKSKNKTV